MSDKNEIRIDGDGAKAIIETCDALLSGSELAGPTGSEELVTFEMQGQLPHSRWDTIGTHKTEEAARADADEYRQWSADRRGAGWKDFRVVKVTTIREILPNNEAGPRVGPATG